MSDPLRVAIVAEGITDKIVIQAAIERILSGSGFVLKQLQPEESLPFNERRGGWGGVYHWCRQAAERSGAAFAQDPLFATFDLLIVHLDADVADGHYADAHIQDSVNDLPCAQPCPLPQATTDPLRLVMLRWLGQVNLPPKTILCTPSKNTEAWVLCALYPQDGIVRSGDVECHGTPQNQLQAKPSGGRTISGGKKIVSMYLQRQSEITSAWTQVRASCTEANRFSEDFEGAL